MKGVYSDTKNIFETRKKDSIVVWHDFRMQRNEYNTNVIRDVKDVFKNVYITNNNMCGIYIPEKYVKDIPLRELKYEEEDPLYTYDILMECIKKINCRNMRYLSYKPCKIKILLYLLFY